MSTPSLDHSRFDLADAMPHIVWTHDADGDVEYFNRAWVEYTGASVERVRDEGADSFVHPQDRADVVRLFVESRQTGAPLESTYRLRRHDGAYRWHRAKVQPLRYAHGRVTYFIGVAIDIDDERQADLERAYLANAGRVLGRSLDIKRTLADVARMIVPELADWCAIDLTTDETTLDRAAVAHVDPAKVELAWDLWRRVPPRPDDPAGAWNVIRRREPEWHSEITDAFLVSVIADPSVLAIMRSLGLRSSMCVPLIGRGHVLGALTMVSAESGRRYGVRDVEFAEEVARRVAIAVENAQLYAAAENARAAAEALAADVAEQTREVEHALIAIRQERDEARTLLATLAAKDGA